MTQGVYPLFGLAEADSAVAKVVHAVPLPQESITQNSQGAGGLREVHTHKGADAAARHLKDVVVRGNGEVVAAQGEGEVGQGGALVTVDRVLAGKALGSTNLLVPWVIVSGGSQK